MIIKIEEQIIIMLNHNYLVSTFKFQAFVLTKNSSIYSIKIQQFSCIRYKN